MIREIARHDFVTAVLGDLEPQTATIEVSDPLIGLILFPVRRSRSLSPSALGQLGSRHLHIGDYV